MSKKDIERTSETEGSIFGTTTVTTVTTVNASSINPFINRPRTLGPPRNVFPCFAPPISSCGPNRLSSRLPQMNTGTVLKSNLFSHLMQASSSQILDHETIATILQQQRIAEMPGSSKMSTDEKILKILEEAKTLRQAEVNKTLPSRTPQVVQPQTVAVSPPLHLIPRDPNPASTMPKGIIQIAPQLRQPHAEASRSSSNTLAVASPTLRHQDCLVAKNEMKKLVNVKDQHYYLIDGYLVPGNLISQLQQNKQVISNPNLLTGCTRVLAPKPSATLHNLISIAPKKTQTSDAREARPGRPTYFSQFSQPHQVPILPKPQQGPMHSERPHHLQHRAIHLDHPSMQQPQPIIEEEPPQLQAEPCFIGNELRAEQERRLGLFRSRTPDEKAPTLTGPYDAADELRRKVDQDRLSINDAPFEIQGSDISYQVATPQIHVEEWISQAPGSSHYPLLEDIDEDSNMEEAPILERQDSEPAVDEKPLSQKMPDEDGSGDNATDEKATTENSSENDGAEDKATEEEIPEEKPKVELQNAEFMNPVMPPAEPATQSRKRRGRKPSATKADDEASTVSNTIELPSSSVPEVPPKRRRGRPRKFSICDEVHKPEKEATVDLSQETSRTERQIASVALSSRSSPSCISDSHRPLDKARDGRCRYCDGFLSVKRLESHPKYCSRNCRKLYKQNVGNASPDSEDDPNQKPSTSKEIENEFPLSPSHPRRDQAPIIIKLPKSIRNPVVRESRPSVAEIPSEDDGDENFETDMRSWSVRKAARWATSVSGSEEMGYQFKEQEIDGASLQLMLDDAEKMYLLLTGNMRLKLGPIMKFERALKELLARRN